MVDDDFLDSITNPENSEFVVLDKLTSVLDKKVEKLQKQKGFTKSDQRKLRVKDDS